MDTFEPLLPIRRRLDRIGETLLANRKTLLDRGRLSPEEIATISAFERRLKAIRSGLEGKPEFEQASFGKNVAQFDVVGLETAVIEWWQELDLRFSSPTEKVQSVSM